MSVRHALLALLSEGPKYGLQLRQEFEAGTGEIWPLNVGQVYSTMQRLERDGLVEADPQDIAEPGPQRRYRVTAAGSEELAAWLRTPPGTDAPPRDELLIKVLVAMRLPDVDVAALLQSHRRHTIGQMQQYTRLKEHAADDVSLLLVADAQLYRLESVVRWLDAAQTRLRHRTPPAADSPPPAPHSPGGSTRSGRSGQPGRSGQSGPSGPSDLSGQSGPSTGAGGSPAGGGPVPTGAGEAGR